MARSRFVPNRAMYDEIASSSWMRNVLEGAADRGKAAAEAIAPEYSGPTWDPAVSRGGEYKKSLYSETSMTPNGWRAEFGATAPWWAQVEYGSGRPATSRERPQHGHSPKTRTLGRALDSLREN